MAGAAAIIIGSIAAATGLAGMGIGLGQSAKQRRAASQSKKESERLMQEARNRMMKDEFENIKLPTESYDRAFRSNTAQQRQALDSLQGADARSLAAGVGKVGALGTAANEQQRLQMGKDLYALELKKAENRNRIQDELVGMDVGAAKDQMNMSADQREAAAASTMSAIQSGISGVSALASSLPDYMKGAADRQAGKLAESDTFKALGTVGADGTTTYGGQVVIDPKTGKPVQTQNTARGADYNVDLKPGDEGYLPEYVDFEQGYTPDEARQKIGENIESIFGDKKSFRQARKEDFSNLTPEQLEAIKKILGIK